LQAPFHPLPNQFPTLILSPFVLGGVGTAYSGAGKFNGSAAVITDAGAYIKFGHAFGGQFNFGAAYGSWKIGTSSIDRYHVFFGESWGF
jgi:hypothetical protein